VARPEKVEAVSEIRSRFDAADAVFITEFAGLDVAEQQALRRGLREGNTEYKVLKMSLTRLAVADLAVADDLDELLAGPTALAFTSGDPVAAAKTLKNFAGEHDALKIKGLLFSGEVLAPEKVTELAALDTREVMLAKVAGMLAAPLTTMAGLMAAFTRNAASMFLQLKDRYEAQGDPNAAAAAGEETPEQEQAAIAATTDDEPPDDSGEEE
jgi:large subunit ribosomal protein L10